MKHNSSNSNGNRISSNSSQIYSPYAVPGIHDSRGRVSRLPKSEVQILRGFMQDACGVQPGSPLERFVADVLADDEVVEAFFHPRVSRIPVRNSCTAPVVFIPHTLAMKAAQRASTSEGIRHHERQLTFVAALFYSCGVFHSTHPLFRPQGMNWTPHKAHARRTTALLLEIPLANLRRSDQALGQTMGEVLGLGSTDRQGYGDGGGNGEGSDPDQVARIATAVYLTNVRVTQLGLA